MLRRIAPLALAAVLCLAWSAAGSAYPAPGETEIRVPQSGGFEIRPSTLSFQYQPPGSYGEEETGGRGLYPPFRLTGLQWTEWHEYPNSRAIARGWLHYDSCEPDCLHGHYVKVRAWVKLDAGGLCGPGSGIPAFQRIAVNPANGPPRRRFIQCTGRVRSGKKADVIPAGVGFYR